MPINPLTPEQIQDLKNSKRLAIETLEQILQAEKAGLDMDNQKSDIQTKIKQIDALLSVYG